MSSRGEQQFCLRWNSFLSNMASSFHLLRSEEEFVDVTLAAGGELIKAHRVILSACSPFFKEVLKNTPCRHPVIVLNDMRAAHVRGILSFMYEGQVNLTPDQMPEFLRAAQALHVKGLFENMAADVPPEDKENVPLGGTVPPPPPPPPPPLLDTRLAAKRAGSASRLTPPPAPPPPPAPKRQRVQSPSVEPCIKEEPTSPVSDEPPSPPPAAPATSAAAPARLLVTHSAASVTIDPIEKSKNLGSALPLSSQGSSSDPDYVFMQFPTTPHEPEAEAHTSYPFPCPFCEKSYTSWGFRRRHIKAFHTSGPTLKCKWCWKVLPTHDEWCAHVTREHHLSVTDAQHAIQILDEANMVLQTSEPLRLDSLVDMVKRQQRRVSSASPPETAGATS